MLSKAQVRFLKSAAHHLQPVVLIGANGITSGVDKELDLALNVHELIKVKLGNLDDDTQQTMIEHIKTIHSAECVQKIGHTAIFFRRNPEQPKVDLPKK
ncbi:YhbY family RNA-binding protein [Suttonella sp. R2A3]|uniref:YhbY family RNA-binding protein n=1 Tax=Suttonella sp. R2A3 TaxID=2908648 RepID=UPI001F225D76|nr:YhbY family RNA-binding protein [Suttonella sp. R2A3]UJF24666.1 YhbY family RNA-binding protein [Suttonella sp. R2A3]